MYHLETSLVRVLWKRCNVMLSSINDLDEHHKWYVMMCVEGSYLSLPSNFGISDGNLEGIFDHDGSCEIGPFVNHEKSGKSNVVRKDNGENEYLEGGKVSVAPYGPCSPPILVLLEGWGAFEEWVPPRMVELLGAWLLPRPNIPPRSKYGTSRKNIPKVSPREEAPMT